MMNTNPAYNTNWVGARTYNVDANPNEAYPADYWKVDQSYPLQEYVERLATKRQDGLAYRSSPGWETAYEDTLKDWLSITNGAPADEYTWQRQTHGRDAFRYAVNDPSGKTLWASKLFSNKPTNYLKEVVLPGVAFLGGGALLGNALGLTGAAGGGGAAGGAASAVGNGAWIGEGVASGVGAWDAAATAAGLPLSSGGGALAQQAIPNIIAEAVIPQGLPTLESLGASGGILSPGSLPALTAPVASAGSAAGTGASFMDKLTGLMKTNPNALLQAGGLLGGMAAKQPEYSGPMPTISRGDWKPAQQAQTMPQQSGGLLQAPQGYANSGLWRFMGQ